ncbi:hypothetical protein IVB03_27870 [Bradyrhizobium sp. 168]|uniref:phage tail assembly chaperone n=1 Tax=Bradyrhizobium sp. 168 TaxID=2782639 RepID=UPI001FFA2C0E|nr:phage tail assembly chaperone [Bradyrhizobium sp. 168]MCK1583278.1 hypothetical protein [Bradyrhizobium sp. 168]
MIIHYDTTTGQVMSYGWGSDHGDGFETSHLPGCKVLVVDNQPIDARTQRVDPVALTIVAKDEPYPLPDRIAEVRDMVRAELTISDKFMLPDYPISDPDRSAWAAYRKALRDASKGNGTAAAMLAAIPARPDGSTLTLNINDQRLTE